MLYVRDVTDVEWWRDLNLPLRSIIQRNGRIVMDTPDWIESEEGKRIFQETAGKTTFSARKVIVDELRAAGDLDGEPTPTKRMTNFYEKGDKPLEIVTSRQWYLKNGGTDEKLNAELIARGKELNFHPDFIRELGARPEWRLADLPSALLRRSVPAVVPGEGGWHRRLRPSDHPERGPSADRPDRRCAGRLHRGSA